MYKGIGVELRHIIENKESPAPQPKSLWKTQYPRGPSPEMKR